MRSPKLSKINHTYSNLQWGVEMKICDVMIEKFRSIKKASFHMNEITAVVGENNSGKTSVLRAINAVLNYSFEEDFFQNRRHQYAAKNNTHITITLSEISENDYFTEYIQDGKLTIKFSFIYIENKRRLSVIKGMDLIPIDDSFLEELSKSIMYVYIPAGRSNKDVLWNSGSIFRELVLNYAAQYTEKKDRISGQVRVAAQKIHDSVLKRLENQLGKLYMQNKLENFNMSFPQDLDYTFLIDKMTLSVNEYGTEYPLQECGSGIKSLVVIAMHRANALLRNGTTVLGIEEPEANLHPQAQKRFILSLKNTISSSDTQAIFTTHSTVLVDSLSHDDILLIRRIQDEKRGFLSSVSKIPVDFWAKYHIEEFKHYQFFNYKNSDFFFSKYVVLGESKNDCQVFQKLIEPEIGDKIADISFLDAGGVDFIKYPYFLLKELQIPFIIIVDRDFFFPYLVNNNLDESRSSITGLPRYADTLKDDDVINDIFNTETQKRRLVNAHKAGYRKFFEFIKEHKLLSMNYCLEMDLTCSSRARQAFYALLTVLPQNQTQKHLLLESPKGLKKIDRILNVLDIIPKTSYPESYTKIKNSILNRIESCV